MADYTFKSGDTFPPIEFMLTQATTITDPARYPGPEGGPEWVKRVDLASAPPDSIRMIAKLADPSTVFDGPMDNVEVDDGAGATGAVSQVEPGLDVPANRGMVRYPLAAGDGDVAGSGYRLEFEVTWDAGSSPPKVQTFPNASIRNPTLDIDPDLD